MDWAIVLCVGAEERLHNSCSRWRKGCPGILKIPLDQRRSAGRSCSDQPGKTRHLGTPSSFRAIRLLVSCHIDRVNVIHDQLQKWMNNWGRAAP